MTLIPPTAPPALVPSPPVRPVRPAPPRRHPAAAPRLAAVAASILATFSTMAAFMRDEAAAAEAAGISLDERLWWYVARAGGLTAWWLLCVAVLWGLLLSTRALGDRPRPVWLLDLHRMLGGLAVVFAGLHGLGVYLDTWAGFGWTELLVPLAADDRTGPVAAGIVALYLLVAVEVTSLLRRRLPAALWRRLHSCAFVVFVLTTVHMFTVGTDSSIPWLRGAAVLTCYGFALLTVVRLGGLRRRPRLRPAPARPPAATPASGPATSAASVPAARDQSASFHPLTVREIVRETSDAVSVSFEVPKELAPVFRFDPGQHLTLRARLDGDEVRRAYSLCSGVTDGELRIAVKLVEGGRASPWVNRRLSVGDVVEVAPPRGRFRTEVNAVHERHLLGVAAGSGITPVLSILRSVLAVEPRSRFTLVYGNRDADSTIFRDRLAGMRKRYGERLRVVHELSRCDRTEPPLRGRINAGKLADIEHLLDLDSVDDAYLCGPRQMTHEVREALVSRGLARERVHVELFGSPSPHPPAATPAEGPGTTRHVAVIDRGVRTELVVRGNETVLDAALRTGLDLPYSCRDGVCGTCRARLARGQVQQDGADLTHAEIDAGYVLTCQARPQADGVVVSLDDA